MQVREKDGQFSLVDGNKNCQTTGIALNKMSCKFCNKQCQYYIVHHIKPDDPFVAVYLLDDKLTFHQCIGKGQTIQIQMYVNLRETIVVNTLQKTYCRAIESL